MPDAAAEFIYNPFILYSKFPFAYRAEGCYTCKRVIMLPRKEVLNMGFFSKMFGSYSDRELKSIYPIVDKIEAMADEYKAMSDAELQAKTPEFKTRLQSGETLDDILPEAFATVREASRRVLGLYPYRVQLVGGVVLHQGRIAEMKTGEGKTLVATLPAYLNALTGNGVHIVTVNDYLAKRDSEWMGKVHRFLGLTVGLIVHDLTSEERRKAYAADITYGTNNEMGFDYLRDNMAIYASELVQRGHAFAIVDEVDSILIDEARTPLIISGMGEKSRRCIPARKTLYAASARRSSPRATTRKRKTSTSTPTTSSTKKAKTATLTARGVKKAEEYFGLEKPLRSRKLHHRAPHQPGHQGPRHDEARYRLRHQGRSGRHRRRVHRPTDVRPPLQRRSAPGHRGQGACRGRARKQDACDHHVPEFTSACTASSPV